MLTLGDLLEEKWEVRRFHLWYMEATKMGLENFVLNIPAEYFHTHMDGEVIIDFHDMYRLLRRKDLDIAQVTIFAL
jgi:pantothenate kinase